MTNAALPASVKDAAAQIRAELKAAFPGTRFSVRKGDGTASAWIDVAWTDGPNRDMIRDITDPYEEFGSPVEGVSHERNLSTAVLMQAQELVRAVLPDLAVFHPDGRYVLDGPGQCPDFHLGGWRFGGGSAYSALVEVADLLILNPRPGPIGA